MPSSSARPACRAGRGRRASSPSAPWRCAPWPWPPRRRRGSGPAAERLQVAQRGRRSAGSRRRRGRRRRRPGRPWGRAPRGGTTGAVAAGAGADLEGAALVVSIVDTVGAMATPIRSSSSPAPRPASAPPPPATPPRPATGSCSPPAPRTSSQALADEVGGRSPCAATSPSGTTSRRSSQRRSTRSAGSTSSSPTPASARARGFDRRRRGLEGDGPHQRLRRGAHDPRRAATPLKASKGHLLLTELGRRPPRAAGLALLRHQARGHGDGRGRAAGPQRHRRARDADRAGHGRHAVLRQPAEDAGARRPTTSRGP